MKKHILLIGGLAASLSLGVWGLNQLNTEQKSPFSHLKVSVAETKPVAKKATPPFSRLSKPQTPDEILKQNLEEKRQKRANGYVKPMMDGMDIYAQTHQLIRTRDGEEVPGYTASHILNELKSLDARKANSKRKKLTEWTSRGPANVPGRAKAIWVLKSDETHNTWLLGTAGGGIWKTTDAGESWADKTPNLPSLAVSTIAGSNGVLYAGTGELVGGSIGVNGMGIAKSTDDGETWDILSATLDREEFRNVNRLIVDPNDANVIVAATTGYNGERETGSIATSRSRIMRSTDGGETWTMVFESGDAIRQVIFHESDFNTQYAALDNSNSGISGGVYKSVDAGVTWANSSDGITSLAKSYQGRIELAIAPSNPNKLYASIVADGTGSLDVNTRHQSDLYVSEDGGTSWDLTLNNGGGDISFLGGQGWYDNTITVNPYNENIVYVGGVNNWKIEITGAGPTSGTKGRVITNISDAYGQYAGINAWSTATVQTDAGPHPDQHFYAVIPVDDTDETFRILVANDGGIFKTKVSADPGALDGDWLFAGAGLVTSQYHGVDKKPGAQEYIGGMQDNSIWRSPSGEEASASTLYSYQFAGDGFDVYWNNRDPNWIIGGSQFNSFQYSTDGGASWIFGASGMTDVGQDANGNRLAPFYSPLGNSRTNPDVLFAIGTSGVWKTSNFGGRWNSTPINSLWGGSSSVFGIPQVKVSDANNQVVWAGNSMRAIARLHVSTDGGETFTATQTYDKMIMGYISGLATHPTEPHTAFALFSFADAPKILKTTDLGQTWQDITGFENGEDVSTNGFPDVATYDLLVMPHDPNMMWAGTELGIMESTDAGATWHPLDSDLPAVAVFDMKIQDKEVIIGTHGRGIWTTEIPELPVYKILAPPKFTRVARNIEGVVDITIESIGEFDSLNLYVDDVKILSLETPAETSVIIENLTAPGSYQLAVRGYSAGIAYSDITSVVLDDPNDIALSYFNDFNSDTDDFDGNGFFIRTLNGFDNGAIHTEHPYATAADFVYELKVPVVIAESNATLQYKDIAIVEVGTEGTVFGDDEFWDYVIVEASGNGEIWVPIIDGYDADAYPDWRDIYDDEGTPDKSNFKVHTIDLLETFEPGEVVYFRFRLFSDPFSTGWGWAIDNLAIQANVPPDALDDEFVATTTTSVSGNLLENDSDDDGDAITASTTLITSPAHGTVVISENGDMTYTPNGDVFTEDFDTFTYEVCDDNFRGSECSEATVTINASNVTSFEDEVAANKLAVRAFPNPASSTTKVEYFLPQSGQVRVSLHTIDGKLVQSLVDANKGSGLQQMSLPVSNLAKGLYLIKLETGNKATVARLLVE